MVRLFAPAFVGLRLLTLVSGVSLNDMTLLGATTKPRQGRVQVVYPGEKVATGRTNDLPFGSRNLLRQHVYSLAAQMIVYAEEVMLLVRS
ncbi:hypothetical protein C8Q80DRAFT_285124 [Daedaleopsis nitida]|nr:hypothetical protein C8Q80DRAFT_285124 [Daedaleopsis nitida]